MKMQFTPILLTVLSSGSLLANPPKVPKAENVYTAFLAAEIYGPSKQSSSIYKNVSSLVKDLHKGKYLGVDLEYDAVKWRGSDNYFHQYWTIVLNKDSGMRVCVFEILDTSSGVGVMKSISQSFSPVCSVNAVCSPSCAESGSDRFTIPINSPSKNIPA